MGLLWSCGHGSRFYEMKPWLKALACSFPVAVFAGEVVRFGTMHPAMMADAVVVLVCLVFFGMFTMMLRYSIFDKS